MSESTRNDAMINGQCRVLASALTWPVEKSKLLYQGGSSNAYAVFTDLRKVRFTHHALGILSSATQRGGSAFLMFQIQSIVYPHVVDVAPSIHANNALAGFLAGILTAPFHTYWEIIKVRGMLPCRYTYLVSLRPMMARHAVFDGTFFGVNSYVGEYYQKHHHNNNTNTGIRFAIAAASASFTNLLFDVWKTRQMTLYPRIVPLWQVCASISFGPFVKNYLVKGTDLTLNWFAVGCIKDALFPTTNNNNK